MLNCELVEDLRCNSLHSTYLSLSLPLSICLCLCLSISVSISVSVSVSASVSVSVSVYLSISVSISVYLSLSLRLSLSLSLSICLCICLCLCLCVCLCLCLSLSVSYQVLHLRVVLSSDHVQLCNPLVYHALDLELLLILDGLLSLGTLGLPLSSLNNTKFNVDWPTVSHRITRSWAVIQSITK